MLVLAWLPVVVIGVSHYLSGAHHHWIHDVLRRMYYLPILFAAFSRGVRGGLAVAVVTSLTYIPHAFFMTGMSHDPGTTLNKALEIVLYNVIGLIAGTLADREYARRRQAERALAQERLMADQLVRAGRLAALGELVAGVAHEIKNPLHTIRGTAEIVDEIIPKEAEQAKMWTLLRKEVERLERVAERFLSFARPSEPDLQRQTLAGVYDRLRELIEAQARGGASGVRVAAEPLRAGASETVVEVDRDQIAQIALNIAGNALRAMNGEGTLRILADVRETRGARWVAIVLENDGPVIAREHLEKIFDPFFTKSDGGTGLGLAIAMRIAESHRGFIEVENTGRERGVRFTLLLPEITNAQ